MHTSDNTTLVDFQQQLSQTPIIPVIRVDDLEQTQQQVEKLVQHGCTNIEITLRTPLGLKAIEMLAQDDRINVGVGTVINHQQCLDAAQSGAKFIVSPGVNDSILKGVDDVKLPFLGGVSTISEAMIMHELGFSCMKFFPAEANGGVRTLKAWSDPMPHLYFCPTGGINAHNFKDYLELPNVVCIGSSNPLELLGS